MRLPQEGILASKFLSLERKKTAKQLILQEALKRNCSFHPENRTRNKNTNKQKRGPCFLPALNDRVSARVF